MSRSVLLIQPTTGEERGVISLGLLSIAAYLNKNGYDAKILVVTTEGNEIESKLREYNPAVVGINFHWFIHSDAREIAYRIKKENPNIRVLLGGFTASYFDRQILEYSENVDGIIRGDGEKPFLDYVSTLNPKNVENITYRNDRKIIRKKVTYVQESLEGFSATVPDMEDIIDGWEGYLTKPIYKAGIHRVGVSSDAKLKPPVESRRDFDVFVGKGCAYNCVYCGGCRDAHVITSGRKKPIFRPTGEVIQDIRNLEANGIGKICIDFGPFGSERYYHRLLDGLGKTDLDVMFTPFRLPSVEILDAFKRIFREVTVEISPETGSESLRKRFWDAGYGKPYYPNKELLHVLERMGDIKPIIYFITGLPFETEKDFNATMTLAEETVKKHKDIFPELQNQIACLPLFLEPASPIDRHSEEMGMKRHRTTFGDYAAHAKASGQGRAPNPLGVESREADEKDVLTRSAEFLEHMRNLE
jgi:radical SAM superfamily enzyme YgiQ (UPF0313 family)